METSVSNYDVIWSTPGRSSADSMPLGNGRIGLNVWTEPSGDVCFYVARTDSWDENGRLVKLGKVRVSIEPAPLVDGVTFSQTLHLGNGSIRIVVGDCTIEVWVQTDADVVHVQVASATPRVVRARLEIWRTQKRQLAGDELWSATWPASWKNDVDSYSYFVYPDEVLTDAADRVAWLHENQESIWPTTMKLQGLASLVEGLTDPLLGRTYGGSMFGREFKRTDATTLSTDAPVRSCTLHVAAPAAAGTREAFVRELNSAVAKTMAQDTTAAKARTAAYWRQFWERSYIHVTGTAEAHVVSRGYALQRFITACAGRGPFPIKFNGSLFTVDNVEAHSGGEAFDPDYRRWGGGYWLQNTRLIYWPMFAAGDMDMMEPFWRLYRDNLEMARQRVKLYYGHEGALFPETMYFFGTYANIDYGWKRDGNPDGWMRNPFVRYYWSGGIEVGLMMLDAYAYSRDADFLRNTAVPHVSAIVEFYDRHYGRDAAGKIRFEPAASLETWQEAVNPLPEIAGLRVVLERLLELDELSSETGLRDQWRRVLGELPEIPLKQTPQGTVIAPAEECIGNARNCENPELYAVFPYRQYGLGRDADLETARRTYWQRTNKAGMGWQQDAIQAALLGLSGEARQHVVRNFNTWHNNQRFPAFWGPNYDWTPDQDNGGVAMLTLQLMLMQEVGGELHMLPAWPIDWNADFRLHATAGRVVEGQVRNGKLVKFTVK